MRRDRYLKHLAAVPMFQALSQKDLILVGRLAEDLKVDAGETLVHEGRREGEFYLIVDGRASVDGSTVQIVPERAVRHRPEPGGVSDCAPLVFGREE